MEANELRIGNLINHNHSIGMKLTGIITTGSDIEMHKDFEPIKLNEEWLLRFGYTKISNNSFIITGHCIWICNDLFRCDKNGIVLKHVHQLQNLYFSLTNQEL